MSCFSGLESELGFRVLRLGFLLRAKVWQGFLWSQRGPPTYKLIRAYVHRVCVFIWLPSSEVCDDPALQMHMRDC